MKKNTLLIGLSLLLYIGCGNTSDNTNGSPATQQTTSLPNSVSYTAPEGWIKQTPSSAMRKDQYALPGVDGSAAAELTVFHFPGGGGTVDANLKRWYGQFTQPDGSSTESKATVEKQNVDTIPVTTVYFTGTYLKPRTAGMMGGPSDNLPDFAVLAIIAETSKGPWFFRATGPEKTIEHWKASFDTFIKSLKAD